MCLPACFVTSADKRQLWVYLCSLLIILPEAICCCLETFNVYVVLLMFFCIIVNKLSWPLLLTLGTFSFFIHLSPKAIYLLLHVIFMVCW